ncbi:MAG: hypothetical protein PHT51_02985 [Patescibacteria group bacterium]|nr:hypothetical protein [Patescibacteria group bacterium]MDD4611340.1 hypothetical protein [Patescibacteria group bacterium]
MINEIKDDLRRRMQKAQESLQSDKKIGVKHLEQLGDEIMSAFDRAIGSLDFKINIFEELKKRREDLKNWKISWRKTFFPINFKYLLSAPFIYGMIIPGVFFHITLEIYHQVCFRFYGIPRVKPGDYFIYDRRLLPYLNWFEKLNCIYCSYFNNLLQYAVEIAGRTERFWCPIKYAKRVTKTHSQYNKFVDYLDAKNFREKWQELRGFSDIKQLEEKKCDFDKNKEKK